MPAQRRTQHRITASIAATSEDALHLKSLELHGFKTFADSTRLLFRPGLTAIVGPNGSGKSNVVDAMLWVLGERSHKAIRTGESPDVIFNGNGLRRPTGMAEVSLTVDNSDGVLPVEFSEVTITRRVYRDGDSEFLLNKTPCRLRDLIELFLDSGVGAGTYSIVGQQDIDRVLSARPEERRELLEHAAGVQKYRFKRAETKRKVERAEQNLTRVRDIMHELESQLAPLAQQAELAREYEQMQRRLRQLTLALLAREYEGKVRRRASLDEQQATAQQQIAEAGEQVAAREVDERGLDRQLRAMEDSIAALQRRVTELLTEVKSKEGQIAVAEERMRSLGETREFLVQEVGMLESRRVGLSHQQEAARAELAQGEAIRSDSEAVVAGAERGFAAATEALTERGRALDGRKESYIESMRGLSDARNLIHASQSRAESYRRRLEALRRVQDAIVAERRDTAATLLTAVHQLERQRSRLESVEDQLAAAEAERRAQRDRLRQRDDEMKDSQREVSETRSRLATLVETQQSLEGFGDGVRAALQQYAEGKLTGPLRLLGELVRVPAELERALGAVLSEAVQILTTENEATAQSVFEWLRASKQGRVSVLPRQLAREGASRADAPVPGARCAADLVECDDHQRDFIRALLGDVWIVADRQEAMAARRHTPVRTCVTLAGQVFHANGLITGGDDEAGAGYLSRRREIGELEARVVALERSRAELQEQMTTTRRAIESAAAGSAQLDQERVAALSAIAALEREVEHLTREGNRLALQVEQVEADARDLKAELAQEGNEQQVWEARLREREQEKLQLDLVIAGLQHQVSELSQARDTVAQQMAEARAQHAAAHERLSAARKHFAELERQSTATVAEIGEKRNATQRALEEDRGLRAKISNDRISLVGLRAQQAEAEQSFDSWRRDRLALVEQLEQLGAELRAARGRLHEAEIELHRLELRGTQVRTEMEEAERRFTEEFELTKEAALQRGADLDNKQTAMEEVAALKQKLALLGQVNLGAISQQQALQERTDFLRQQREDLELAQSQLEEIIAEIDGRTRDQFMTAFEAIQREFDYMFSRIFDGGGTQLLLTHPDNLLESGVDIRVQLPGKGESEDLIALSGGQRALTALALMLALLRVKPSPFCVLDEVDAPLDQSNVGRFTDLLREFGDKTQFIVITHNNGTMEAADALYGVTMQERGVSKLISMRLVDAQPVRAAA